VARSSGSRATSAQRSKGSRPKPAAASATTSTTSTAARPAPGPGSNRAGGRPVSPKLAAAAAGEPLEATETYSGNWVPAWTWVIGTLLCLIGLGVAAYLTYAHFNTSVVLACPDKGLINCTKVTTSSYSKVFGIPVALLGLLYFVFMVPLQLPWAWRSTNPQLRMLRMAASAVGVAFVLWLLFAELVEIRNICLYCSAVHIITFAVFISTAFATIATSTAPED
jgi:uncharacterized membrane protein